MAKSSIPKQPSSAERTSLAEAIGAEIRQRRRLRGLTQQELAAPYTKAFISAVELGYAIPSVPALALLAERLGIGLDELFRGVNRRWTGVYNAVDGQHDPPPRRRR